MESPLKLNINLGQEYAQALTSKCEFAAHLQNLELLNDGKDLVLQELKAEDNSHK